jgi:hypothetical protein
MFDGGRREGRIGRLRDAVCEYAADFDPARLSPADAAVVVGVVATMEASLAAIKAVAAARAAESAELWKKAGHRSAAEALAKQTGSTVGQARDTLELGRQLAERPEVADAARAGRLSPTQAGLICDATADNPDAAGRLLDHAEVGSVATLRQACAEEKAAGGVDLEERRQRIHRRRSLRSWTDPDGTWHLAAQGNPEAGAQLMSVLQPLTDAEFDRARAEGRRERHDAYAFDALIAFATHAASADPEPAAGKRRGGKGRRRRGAPVKLLIRVDYDTWLRGFPVDGETCELVGYGPVSMGAVNQLVEGGDPFVAAILTKAKQVVGVAHLGRKPTAYQRSALEWLNPTCTKEDCPIPWDHLEIDHRVDWAKSHVTALDDLDGCCPWDHWLKTHLGWAFVEGGHDKRAFVPPDDPRHPNNQRRNATERPPPD